MGGEGKRWGRVLVIGNSIAGLLAARVLADHADTVTIIDRDRIPDGAVHRAGVPHSRHIHVVLAAGQRAMESLLPGVLDELSSLGVPAVGMPRDIVQRNRGRWVRRWPPSLAFLTGTRPLVEHVVRQRVLADARIEAFDSIEAVGLAGDRRQVGGVRLRPRGGGGEETWAADLVVDASGRGSRTAAWLTAIGARPPAEERIETGLAYATRRYRASLDPAAAEYLGIYLLPRPGAGRGAVVMPIEEPGRYLVTLTGLPGEEPPTDPDAFEDFTASLEHPIVHEWLQAAEAEGPPLGYRSTANIRRRYDRGSGPEGLLVVGDAATCFNPVYGQGISVAAAGAQALHRALAGGQPPTRRLQGLVIAAGAQAWQISTGVDKMLPTATGNAVRSGLLDRAAAWYLGRVQDHAASDMLVGNAFRDVVHLVAPVASLFDRRVARTVLLGRAGPGPATVPLHPEDAGSPSVGP